MNATMKQSILHRIAIGLALVWSFTCLLASCQMDELPQDPTVAPPVGDFYIANAGIAAVQIAVTDNETRSNVSSSTATRNVGSRNTPATPDAQGYTGAVKTNFVAGDVLHLCLDYNLTTDPTNLKTLLATATYTPGAGGVSNGTWTLSSPLTLPKGAKHIYLSAYYDALPTAHTTRKQHFDAYNLGTTLDPGRTISYVDILSAEYYYKADDDGKKLLEKIGGIAPAGNALTIDLAHANHIVSITSIVNGSLPTVTAISARLSSNNPNTDQCINVDIPLSAPSVAEDNVPCAIVPSTGTAIYYDAADPVKYSPVLTHFVAALKDVSVPLTIAVPDDGMPVGSDGKYVAGRRLVQANVTRPATAPDGMPTGCSYAYRLFFSEGSLKAEPTTDLTAWGDTGYDPAVPQGYIPIRNAADLAKVGRGSIAAGSPGAFADLASTAPSQAAIAAAQRRASNGITYTWLLTDKYIQLNDIDLTPGLSDGAPTTIAAAEELGYTTGITPGISINPDGKNPASWEPIGSSNSGIFPGWFKGIYHGGGYVIHHLTITGTGNYRGLFGAASTATLNYIRLRDARVAGSSTIGTLVGQTNTCTIAQCSSTATATGTATVSGGSSVGGLVGYSNSQTHLTRCYTQGVVVALTDKAYGNYVGGLVGYNSETKIASCYVAGVTVTSVSTWDRAAAGALVGLNQSNADIYACYASTAHAALSNGQLAVGALVGENNTSTYDVRITSCYAATMADGWTPPLGQMAATRLVGKHSAKSGNIAYTCFSVAPNKSYYGADFAVTDEAGTSSGQGENDTPGDGTAYQYLLQVGTATPNDLTDVRTVVVSDGTVRGLHYLYDGSGGGYVDDADLTPKGGIAVVRRTWKAARAWNAPGTSTPPYLNWGYEGE